MLLSPSDKYHYAILFSICLLLLLSQIYFVSRIQLFSYLSQCHIIHNICRQLGDSRNVLYDLTIFLFFTCRNFFSRHLLSRCILHSRSFVSSFLSTHNNSYHLSLSLSLYLSLSISSLLSEKR